MGNNACNGVCEKTPTIESFDDQFLPTQTLIPCQICNVHLDEKKFKEHIDHFHFCSIVEDKQGLVHAQCLLCEYLSTNLDEQAKHITLKHPYAKSTETPLNQKSTITSLEKASKLAQSTGRIKLYKTKKEEMIKLSSQKDFTILKSVQSTIQVSIKSEKYEGELQIREYRGAQFDQDLIQGELIWYKVFTGKKQYQYYFLDIEPKERTITCKAYIFSLNNKPK